MAQPLTLFDLFGEPTIVGAVARWPQFVQPITGVIGNWPPPAFAEWLAALNNGVTLSDVRTGADGDRVAVEAKLSMTTVTTYLEGFPFVISSMPDVEFRVQYATPVENQVQLFASMSAVGDVELVLERVPVEIRLPPGLIDPHPDPGGGVTRRAVVRDRDLPAGSAGLPQDRVSPERSDLDLRPRPYPRHPGRRLRHPHRRPGDFRSVRALRYSLPGAPRLPAHSLSEPGPAERPLASPRRHAVGHAVQRAGRRLLQHQVGVHRSRHRAGQGPREVDERPPREDRGTRHRHLAGPRPRGRGGRSRRVCPQRSGGAVLFAVGTADSTPRHRGYSTAGARRERPGPVLQVRHRAGATELQRRAADRTHRQRVLLPVAAVRRRHHLRPGAHLRRNRERGRQERGGRAGDRAGGGLFAGHVIPPGHRRGDGAARHPAVYREQHRRQRDRDLEQAAAPRDRDDHGGCAHLPDRRVVRAAHRRGAGLRLLVRDHRRSLHPHAGVGRHQRQVSDRPQLAERGTVSR